MKNLLEQLDRMKGLMVYQKGTPINEISTNVQGVSQSKQTTTTTKSTGSNVEKKESGVSAPEGFQSKDCKIATHTEPFGVSETVNEGVKNFINYFIGFLEKNYGNIEGGKLSITGIKVFGGASNENQGLVKPEWCNEYDEEKGTTSLKKWSSGCKGFGSDGDTRYGKNDAGTKDNDRLSLERAEGVLEGVINGLEKIATENNIEYKKISVDEAKFDSGTVYTNDKVDTEPMHSDLNRGQIVMIDATVCFTKDEPKKCGDRCQDPNNDCKCKDGLNEVDGKCVCEDGSTPDENCGCEKKKKSCPTCQELDEKKEECKCQKGLKEEKDGEGNIKCVCPNEGEELIKSGAKCECKKQPKPPECNQTYEIKGGRGTKPYNFVTKAFQRKWPFEGTGQVTISFNPLVVPDAFYVKYGEQEFWSGFVGDVYKMGDGLYKMSSVPRNQKERFYKDIFPSKITSENDTSIVDRYPRNFAGELVWYKQNDGLLESINAEISKVGGTPINNIFKNGDGNAEKITNGIKNTKTKLKDIYDSYGNVLKGDTSFTLKKESGEEENIMIIVFSPLSETLFNMKIECK